MTLREAVQIIEQHKSKRFFQRPPEFHMAHKTIMGMHRRCGKNRYFSFSTALHRAKSKVGMRHGKTLSVLDHPY